MFQTLLHTLPTISAPRDNGVAAHTPERHAALIARAKDILAGRIQPEPLAIPQAITDHLQREFGDKVPPPTPAALKYITDRLSLEAHYQGQPVVCHTTPDGTQVVLACGEDEIRALYAVLTPEEGARVMISDTLSW